MSEKITLEMLYEKLLEHDKRFDEMDKKIDALQDRVDHHFAALAYNVNQVDERVERLENRELA